jgi:hypothetical protein
LYERGEQVETIHGCPFLVRSLGKQRMNKITPMKKRRFGKKRKIVGFDDRNDQK